MHPLSAGSSRGRAPIAAAMLAIAALAACGSPAKSRGGKRVGAAPAGDVQHGMASWYGRGQGTASGERFDKRAMTAAHRSFPMNTRVRVTNQRNGRAVILRINDRGPFVRGRIIDVTPRAAGILGFSGLAPVTIAVVGRGG